MAPRTKLTLSDLKPAMAEAAAKPAPAPEPIPLTVPRLPAVSCEQDRKVLSGLGDREPPGVFPGTLPPPPAPGLAPGEMLKVVTPDCNCRPPVACLFGGAPVCEAPRHIRRGCPYATGDGR